MIGHDHPLQSQASRGTRSRRFVAVVVAVFVAFASMAIAERSDRDITVDAARSWFVATGGSDGNDGTSGRPLATLQEAINRAGNGDQINLAAGVYRQEATVAGKTVHIRGAGIDRTVLDGSRRVTNWSRSGSSWSTPWTPITPRAEDIQTTASRRVAGFPEQVFFDGQPLTEVASIAELTDNTFFTDLSTNRIHVGTNPSGRLVEASTLTSGLYLNRAPNSSVSGLTVQRFATPQSKMAALRAYSDNATITDVAVRNNAYGGISAIGSDITFNRVTATYNGHNGMHGHRANRLAVTGARLIGNNTERFDASWAAGAIKVTTTQGFTFTDGIVDGNNGPAVWTDLDVTDSVIARNVIRGNMRSGIMLELSQRAVVADNLIVGNGQAGLYVLESTDVELWNNTVADNHWDLRILTGPRADVDRVDVFNNVFGGSVPSRQAIMHADDWTSNRSAAQMNIEWNNNRIWMPPTSQGRWISRIQNWPASQSLTTTIEAHRQAIGGQGAASELSTAANNPFAPRYLSGDGRAPSNARLGNPLPANVAAIVNVAPGTRPTPGTLTAIAGAGSFPNWGDPEPDTAASNGPVYSPRNVVVGQSPTGLQVSWSAPQSGQVPPSYAIWLNGEEVTIATALATEIPPHESGQSYVQVQSIGSNGARSAKTEPVAFGGSPTPAEPPAAPPATAPPTPPAPLEPAVRVPSNGDAVYAPRDVTASAVDATTLAVSWAAPRGGQLPYFYIVYVNGRQVATTNALTANVAAAEQVTSSVQIQAVAVGAVSVKTTPVDVAPFATTAIVELRTPANVVVGGATVSWKANGSKNVRYQVWANGNLVALTAGTSAVLPEANSDGVYVEVSAVAPDGQTSSRTAPVKVSRREYVATSSSVGYATSVNANYTDGRIAVSWQAPTSRKLAASYNVWSNGILVAPGVDGTSVTLPPASGDQYVQVQSVTSNGERSAKTAPVRVDG